MGGMINWGGSFFVMGERKQLEAVWGSARHSNNFVSGSQTEKKPFGHKEKLLVGKNLSSPSITNFTHQNCPLSYA